MKLASFTRACRRSARQAPYHPERFIDPAQAQQQVKQPKAFWPRIATIGGAALVTAAAVAVTLFTPLFREGIPGLVPGGSSDASEPPGEILVDVSREAELLRLEKVWNYLYLIGNSYYPDTAPDPQNTVMILHLLGGSAFQNSIVQGFQDALGDTQASQRLGLGEKLDQDGYNETGHRLFTKISLSDLNRIVQEYFVDLQFKPEDFPDRYILDNEKAFQWIYDQETDSVYLAVGAIGFTEPYNRYVVCEKEELGNGLTHYKMAGVYTESEEIEAFDFSGANVPETFADYQNTLIQLVLSGEGTPCTLLDVTVKITDNGWLAVEQASLTEDSGDGEIRKQIHSLLPAPSSVRWTGIGSAAKLLKLQDVLGEFCSTDPGRERLDPDRAKSDPTGFLDSFFWLLVGLQERNQYVFPYDDPDYRDVVERLRLSVPMSSEEYGVADTRFDVIYRFPLEALNASVVRYFQGIRFEPGDFPTQVPEAPGKAEESAFVYDQITGCVYMLTIATGREDPRPLMLICDEQAQGSRITYTMLGIERSEGDDFSLQEEEDPTLIDSTRFGDFQQRLGNFAEANPDRILYTARVTVDTAGEYYAIVSLETSGLNPANSGDWQTIQERLAASRDLRAAIAQATPAS